MTETKESSVVTEATEAMIQLIERGGGVTFIELVRACKEVGMETEGTMALALPEDPNILLWAGVSGAFCDAFEALRDSGRAVPRPSSQLTYLFDGGMPKLPVAKRLPKGGYKTERWLPVVFWTPEDIERLNPIG